MEALWCGVHRVPYFTKQVVKQPFDSAQGQRALNARLTYDDYAAIPSDGKTYQIVDGEVYVTPAPSPKHQHASKRLFLQLLA